MINETALFALRRITKRAYRIRGVGLGRICEALRRSVARSWLGPQLQIDDFMGGLKFNCDLREHMGSQIFWKGHYSGGQLRLLKRHLERDSVFVDIGANHGEFSIYAAGLVGPKGRVIAFEPVSAVRKKLVDNVSLNGFDNVTIFPMALSDRSGELSIYSSAELLSDGTLHEGLPTLYPIKARGKELEKVPVRTLDDISTELGLDRLDLIKLDIEGGELAALNGAQQTISRFRPTLMLEVAEVTCRAAGHSPIDLIEWIEQRGYRIELIRHDGSTQPLRVHSGLTAFQNVVAVPERS